jgi:predicted RNA-binding protein with EMAP domain
VATIKYPERYSLKSDADRIKEAQDLEKLMAKVPGRRVKRELAKGIVQTLLGGKISMDDLAAINREIDNAHYTTSDPQTIIQAAQAGLVGEKTSSVALGFDDDEYLEARKDHAERVKRIAEAQGMEKGGSDPAARGIADLSADPNAGKEEKAASRNTDLQDTTAQRVRGKGRFAGE